VTVRFLEVAQRELDEAIAHYNDQSPGLGDAFLLETVAALDRIRDFHAPGIRSVRARDAAGCAAFLTG
jgi:hypothetical protein